MIDGSLTRFEEAVDVFSSDPEGLRVLFLEPLEEILREYDRRLCY